MKSLTQKIMKITKTLNNYMPTNPTPLSISLLPYDYTNTHITPMRVTCVKPRSRKGIYYTTATTLFVIN